MTAYPQDRREWAVQRVVEGLRKGTPLTVICSADGMPCDDTVRAWAAADEEIGRAIARAREAGFDAIAMDALAIADEVTDKDTIPTAHGEIPNKEWIMRSKLRVDTRLKLLSKWDPKRYGEATMLKHADADGNTLDLAAAIMAGNARLSTGE